MTGKSIERINNIAEGIVSSILVQRPCSVINVHSQYLVDVEYYYNNQVDYLYKVPVRHNQTGRAFVFLSLKPGDKGIISFFDSNISDYIQSKNDVYADERKHDINDGLFSTGFYPLSSQYIFPEGDIVIGTVSGAEINLSGSNITISGGNISVSGSSVNLGSNVVIDGKNFLEHTHSNGNKGANTGGVI